MVSSLKFNGHKNKILKTPKEQVSEIYHLFILKSKCNPFTRHDSNLLMIVLTALPIIVKKDSAVPIVPDNCGVYGTFYVDLTGDGMKTFNSPTRRTKVPHANTQRHGTETIRITQSVAKPPDVNQGQVIPWKRALPSQPSMGVRKESWEKNFKRGTEVQFRSSK